MTERDLGRRRGAGPLHQCARGDPRRDRGCVARRRLCAGDDADEIAHDDVDGLLLRGPDGSAVAQLTVVDSNIETAVGIATGPGLVFDRGAVASVVAERK